MYPGTAYSVRDKGGSREAAVLHVWKWCGCIETGVHQKQWWARGSSVQPSKRRSNFRGCIVPSQNLHLCPLWWYETRRRFAVAARGWGKLSAFLDIFSTTPVPLLLRRATAGAAGRSQGKWDQSQNSGKWDLNFNFSSWRTINHCRWPRKNKSRSKNISGTSSIFKRSTRGLLHTFLHRSRDFT